MSAGEQGGLESGLHAFSRSSIARRKLPSRRCCAAVSSSDAPFSAAQARPQSKSSMPAANKRPSAVASAFAALPFELPDGPVKFPSEFIAHLKLDAFVLQVAAGLHLRRYQLLAVEQVGEQMLILIRE